MSPAETLQRLVALEFKVPCSALNYKTHRTQLRDIALARHVWIYLLVQFLPDTPRGANKPVARMLSLHPSGVRYALRRIEDMRDDAEFDTRLSRLEAVAAGA